MSDFTITVPKKITTEEVRAVELRQLVITRGAAGAPGSISMWLHPLGADGAWDTTAEPTIINIDDDAAASGLRNLILDAVVADSPLAQAYGIVGQPVRLAGRAVLQALGKV